MESCVSAFHTSVLNIHYFIEYILKAAYSDSRWSISALENAVKWAAYCEKVSKMLRQRNVRESVKLNNCISELVKEVPDCLIQDGNVSFLYLSTQILLILLLNNNKLPSVVFFQVLDMFHDQKRNTEQALVNILRMNCKELVIVIQRIQSQSRHILTDTWSSLAAVLLIKHMHKQREQCLTDTFLMNFMKNDQRLTHLLSAAALPESLLIINSKDCQSFLTNWLCQRLQKEKPEASSVLWNQLWKQPELLVVAVAVRQEDFFDIYFQQLLKAGQAMKPSYSENKYTWLGSRELDVTVNFANLVSHIKALLSTEGKVKDAVLHELQERVSQPGCSIWEDVLAECK